MKKTSLIDCDLNELLATYTKAAIAHHNATMTGEYRETNKQHDIVADVYRELRRRGLSAQQGLLTLLSHPEESVRAWSAAHALDFAPHKGLPVLTELTNLTGILGLDAQTVLREYGKGTLKFP